MRIKNFKSWIKRPIGQLLPSIYKNLYDFIYLIQERWIYFDFKGYIPIYQKDGSIYHAYSNYYLKLLLNDQEIIDENFQNFIDIGSGKGKICIYVAKNYKFEKIIGIEYQEKLYNISVKNLNLTSIKYLFQQSRCCQILIA